MASAFLVSIPFSYDLQMLSCRQQGSVQFRVQVGREVLIGQNTPLLNCIINFFHVEDTIIFAPRFELFSSAKKGRGCSTR